ITEIKRQRIPIHSVGFGREKPERDIELLDIQMPARVLADSRIAAQVALRSYGHDGRKARLTLKDGGKVLATREISLKPDGMVQSETVVFSAGSAGAKSIQTVLEPISGEENQANNAATRLLNVDGRKPRILYIEGEPKWEYKFVRRAVDDDKGLELVSMIRTTPNKIYRQGVSGPNELQDGFPATVDELFAYDGIVIGDVEVNYFTNTQQELLKQFVDRRGGGLLFLAGRAALSDGGWNKSTLADLLPVTLPDRKGTFVRDPAKVELTPEGRDSLLCRIEENPDKNVERWKNLPYLKNYQDTGSAKPGAVVLASMSAANRRMPLLVTQNYGRGRTALFATAGSWRWQMLQPVEDMSHEMFWRQLLRWAVAGTMGPVISSTSKSVYSDEIQVSLKAEIRDRNYLPVTDAQVKARVLRPDGAADEVDLRPDPVTAGVYSLDWGADKSGAYVAEVIARRGEQELGRDVITFRREDGVAENFRTHQNRELLEKLAEQTGGRYYRPADLTKLGSEIAFSEAGISTRETRDLWDMPIVFMVALILRSSEWLLRRKWGVV
ncbi:MAG TPA: glutamine amidotransferase, partial [Bryobacteraceae bacterium]|nr:glutamine amidotransferase [Bryobacteraceae bacterium]